MLMGCIPVGLTTCQGPDNMEEEIRKTLEPQGIIAVKRISVCYSLYAMTIKGQDILEKKSILDTWK